MAKLVECASCGGLKRSDSARCPHCEAPFAPASSLLVKSLAAAGLGAIVTCGPIQTPCSDPAPLGACGSIESQIDSGFVPADAYGIGPLIDSGFMVGVDAYGVAPIVDAGPPDGGDDGGPKDAG
jgi:hypothetical protein